MSDTGINQELTDVRWGTGMPSVVMIGADMLRVRARGTFSVTVEDIQKLNSKIEDLTTLKGRLTSLLVSKVTDSISELGAEVSDINEILGASEKIVSAVKTQMESLLQEMGLRLMVFSVEAVEKM